MNPFSAAADGLEITPEFHRTLDTLEFSHRNVFLSGKAGTGKSTLLRLFRTSTTKRVAVLAPTGIAAINVEGQTIHSFFRLPLHFIEQAHVRPAGRYKHVIEKLDTLVIDEVSMVRADVLDAVDTALRLNRGNPRPFGGVQLVFFGDLLQLPPVIDPEMMKVYERRYASPFFFSARSFGALSLERIELTKVFRQIGDPEFLSLLNRLRGDGWDGSDLAVLNQRVIDGDEAFDAAECIVLTTTNGRAAAINERQLARLQGAPSSFEAAVTGKFEPSSYPTDAVLRLKKGAQVMLVRNDMNKRWVNGDIGVVEEVTEETVRVSVRGTVYDIERAVWEKYEYTYDDDTEMVGKEVVGTFEQFPLKLAWAITIHKSQGQTFEKVVVDMGAGAFAHGQAYVALSRCTTMKGLRLARPLQSRDILFDKRVLEFAEVGVKSEKTVRAEPVEARPSVRDSL